MSTIKETLPGSQYQIKIAGLCEGARLFASRFELLDYVCKGFLRRGSCVVAEVGVFHGHFSEVLLERLQPERLFLIDTFSTFDHVSNLFDAIGHYDFVTKRFAASGEKVVMCQGISWECLRKLEDKSLDYLYIDAGHTYRDVKLDIEASLSKMKDGGIIQFNDYTNAYNYGVLDAVNELLESDGRISILGMSLDRSGYHDLCVQYATRSPACRRPSVRAERASAVAKHIL